MFVVYFFSFITKSFTNLINMGQTNLSTDEIQRELQKNLLSYVSYSLELTFYYRSQA